MRSSFLKVRPGLWLRGVAGGLWSLVLIIIMWRWFEHSQIYHPTRALDVEPSAWGQPFENVRLTTADGVRIHGWVMPAQSHALRRDWGVLVLHGNGGNISHRQELYALLLEMGCNVLAVDYRGYGQSAGRPTEAGTYLDAEAAYDWLRQKGFPGSRLIALGESLGCGVATELAVRKPLGGLVLQSGFTSIPDLGAEIFPFLPVRWLVKTRYDNRAKLPRIKIPVMILHSRADGLIGFHHAERNFAAANAPKWLEELRGAHNDALLVDRAQYRAALERFFTSWESPGGASRTHKTVESDGSPQAGTPNGGRSVKSGSAP